MKENELRSSESQENDVAEYLKSGEQTIITSAIESIAISIEKAQQDKVRGILDFVKTLPYKEKIDNWADIFRKRTVDQIISDGWVEGCADISLVFISIARALKIPTKYVEAVDLDWLKGQNESFIHGHVYAKVFNDKSGWTVVDPTSQKIDANIEKDDRVVFKEGLDSWDIGIRDFDSLKEQFTKFRVDWKQ